MTVEVTRADLVAVRAALMQAAARSERLLAGLADPDLALPGSAWSVTDVGAHLLVGLRCFTDAIDGDLDPWRAHVGEGSFQARLAGFNTSTIAEEPRRDPAVVGRLVVEGARAFLDASDGREPGEVLATPWYGPDDFLPLGAATCLLLAEQVVHGYDVARAAGVPWDISAHDAYLVFHAVMAMLPRIVDPEAVRGLSATYDIQLRGGARFLVRVADGAVAVEPPGRRRADCRLSVDPVAFLLVGYGRIGQWQAIRQRKLVAWGRRPWLGLRLKGLFFDP